MKKLAPTSVKAFVHAFMLLLPTGAIWPRSPQSNLYKLSSGLMAVVAAWSDRVKTFINSEAFPPTSYELLESWEKALGLPDQCTPEAQSTQERLLAINERLGSRPGQASTQYFKEVASRLGYQIEIQEFRPFMCGVSGCGNPDWTIAPPEMRYTWVVKVPDPRLAYFRCGHGGGQVGVNPLMSISRADDLECILQRLKPAHTNLIFNYEGA